VIGKRTVSRDCVGARSQTGRPGGGMRMKAFKLLHSGICSKFTRKHEEFSEKSHKLTLDDT
jgi:hypothetical protein